MDFSIFTFTVERQSKVEINIKGAAAAAAARELD